MSAFRFRIFSKLHDACSCFTQGEQSSDSYGNTRGEVEIEWEDTDEPVDDTEEELCSDSGDDGEDEDNEEDDATEEAEDDLTELILAMKYRQ